MVDAVAEVTGSDGQTARLAYTVLPAPRETRRTLVLVHANGHIKELWRPVVEDMRRGGDDSSEVVLVDARAHGDSYVLNAAHRYAGVTENDRITLDDCGHDLAQFAAILRDQRRDLVRRAATPPWRLLVVAHSAGGTRALLAQLAGARFDGMFLIEPGVSEGPLPRGPDDTAAAARATTRRRANTKMAMSMRNAVVGRPRTFESREAMLAQLAAHPIYARWDVRALQLHVEHATRERTAEERAALDAHLTITSKVPLAVELAVYNPAPGPDSGDYSPFPDGLYDNLKRITVPTRIVYGTDSLVYRGPAGSGPGTATAPRARAAASLILGVDFLQDVAAHRGASIQAIPGQGHLMVMEAPGVVARAILSWIDDLEASPGPTSARL